MEKELESVHNNYDSSQKPSCSVDCLESFKINRVLSGDERQPNCSYIEDEMPNCSFIEEGPLAVSKVSPDDSEVEITRLPTLHIEHDDRSFKKLKLHYALTWLVALLGIAVTAAVSIGLFTALMHSHTSNGSAGRGIGTICALVGMFFVWLTKKAFSKATSYFKRQFLRGELEAFCEIDDLKDVKNEISPDAEGCALDYLFCASDGALILDLGLGSNNWNKGEINDDIIGNYLGAKFRFLDVFLVKETKQGKSTKTDNIFEGQVYIFKTNLHFEHPIQYNYFVGNKCCHRSDFKNAFAKSRFNRVISNPFEQTPSLFEHASVMSMYERESGPCFDDIETPDFVDNMLRLGQRIPSNLWGVRFVDDKFILVISRFENVFELSRMSPRRSLAHLDKDMQEFVDILSIVSQMNFIAKD